MAAALDEGSILAMVSVVVGLGGEMPRVSQKFLLGVAGSWDKSSFIGKGMVWLRRSMVSGRGVELP